MSMAKEEAANHKTNLNSFIRSDWKTDGTGSSVANDHSLSSFSTVFLRNVMECAIYRNGREFCQKQVFETRRLRVTTSEYRVRQRNDL